MPDCRILKWANEKRSRRWCHCIQMFLENNGFNLKLQSGNPALSRALVLCHHFLCFFTHVNHQPSPSNRPLPAHTFTRPSVQLFPPLSWFCLLSSCSVASMLSVTQIQLVRNEFRITCNLWNVRYNCRETRLHSHKKRKVAHAWCSGDFCRLHLIERWICLDVIWRLWATNVSTHEY